MEKKISVKDLLMQAFLTGWELSDKSISQDEAPPARASAAPISGWR